jgi:2-oxoisovalerate dehydrogenase E1 component
MTKSLFVDPVKVRKASTIKIPSIPVNQYKMDWDKELKRFGADGLKNMLHDMITIREFENMLNSLKQTGAWQGIEYNHKGPAHLSMGQEASSVGQAAELDADDFIFGSHRSHGEILAKSFSAARKIGKDQLQKIMTEFLDGETLKYAESLGYQNDDELLENFILFGTMAEIFARKAGFNRGMGGSMHAFFTPFGSMPNNAIVGGSAPIAQGAALYKRINHKPGIVIANIGDASMGCGPVWEAMMFSAMDQFRNLWRPEDGGNPPILFNFFNNFYGMGGQTSGETMGYDILARVGAGVNPENMHAERVDGFNPLAVADAIRRKRDILEKGEGPVLLDTITYRFGGHSPSDASSYRTHEEVETWENVDSITAFADLLIDHKIMTADDVAALHDHVDERIHKTLELTSDSEKCPRVDVNYIESAMFSNGHVEAFGDADEKPELLTSLEENPRVKALAKKVRKATDENGKPVSKVKMFQYRDGLFEAMAHRFAIDPTMAAWGEENRDWGGAFAVYRGLTELLPYRRLFNSPISEAAIVGAGVGYALSGGRAVVELMYCDFLGRAGDEVFNQAAKWQSMSANLLKMPLVIRVSVGNKYGAQHSQEWSALVSHIPGLKVYLPATPTDAKGMLNLALAGTDPVVFLEPQLLYDKGEEFEPDGVPTGYYETPEGEPAIRREGSDITICTLGATLYRAMEAAETLQSKYGMSAEVIDLRFVTPLNYEKIIASVRKTGRLLLASDAVERGSFLNTVAQNVQNLAFDALDAPVVVVGSRNHITPAPELEQLFFPQPSTIIDAIHTRIVPLPGHEVSIDLSDAELLRRDRLGV